MKSKFLSWHSDDRLKWCGLWQVSVLQPSYLKAADVPYIRPQGPHSFQGPPPFYHLTFSKVAWSIIQIATSA